MTNSDTPESEPSSDDVSEGAKTNRLAPAPEQWRAGTKVGKYLLERVLGQGGFGRTLLGKREGPWGSHFEKLVCLKVMRPDRDRDPEFEMRMLDEAKLQAALRHDNIVDVYDFTVIEEDFVIEMQFVDGVTLSQFIASYPARKVPVATSIYLVTRILNGEDWMHNAEDAEGNALRLIHRDIKPGNIFLDRSGSIKIGDFGLVKGQGRQFETRQGLGLGTQRYMSPEQLSSLKEIDHKADIYATGVMLYAMLSGGKHPARHHELENDFQRSHATLLPDRVPLKQVAPQVLEEVCKIVDRMVAFDPAERPRAMEAKRALLQAVRIDLAEEDIVQERVNAIVKGRPVATLQVTRGAAVEETDRLGSQSGVKPKTAVPEQVAPEPTKAAPPAPVTRGRRRWATYALVGLTAAVGAFLGLRDGVPRAVQSAPPSIPAPRQATASDPAPGAASEQATAILPLPATTPAIATGVDLPRSETPTNSGAPIAPPKVAVESAARPSGAADTEVRRTATLRISVIPHGEVWVDGKNVGPSPIELKVAPGVHRVAGGHSQPELTQTIGVKDGQNKRVQLELKSLFE